MVAVKKASALTNLELRTISTEVAQAIVQACDAILHRGQALDSFPIPVIQGGAGTSINMNTNEVISNLALEQQGFERGRYDVIHPNDHVNRSQSTNDVFPTGLRLAIHHMVDELKTAVTDLSTSLTTKSLEFDEVLKMGRTQLQDAVPMTLGQEFSAFAALLHEENRQLTRNQELLLEVNLGATAIGTGLNAPEGYAAKAVKNLASVTGLPVTSAPNLIEATSDAGAFVSMHTAVKRVAVKLGKVCNDLRLLSSGPRTGLNEINLPQMQAGSSIMPAKVNPVIPEMVNQVCFKVMGNDMTVSIAAEAGQLQLNVMEPVIAHTIFESLSILTSACRTLQEQCVAGITANRSVCEGYVNESIGVVTLLNPMIGHEEAERVGQEAARTGASVRDICLARGILTSDELAEALSPNNLRKPRYMGPLFDEPETIACESGETA